MRRKSLIVLLVLLFLAFLAANTNFRPVKTLSTTVIVPDDFPTIQEAINEASDAGTIFVKAGIYYEHVFVNKTVSLVGEDVSTTIIDGNNTGHVVNVISDNVNITGLTVQNSGDIHMPNLDAGFCLNGTTGCTISENRVINNGFCGISLLYSNENTITHNNLSSAGWGGIHLLSSSHNIVSGNKIAEKYGGINGHVSSNYNNISENYITSSTYGMFFHASNHNNICRNKVSTIAAEGIWLQDQVNHNVVAENTFTNNTVAIRLQGPNTNNTLSRNLITGAEYGIEIQNSNYNAILENNITRNGYGFYIEYSAQNTIWGNNIVDNDHQVYLFASSVNNWDGGYPIGGNYWSDYNGTDADLDGIGDTPYVIDADNADNYPHMTPYIIPEFPSFLNSAIFLAITMLAVMTYRRKHKRRLRE